jgi:hypothetical protein
MRATWTLGSPFAEDLMNLDFNVCGRGWINRWISNSRVEEISMRGK